MARAIASIPDIDCFIFDPLPKRRPDGVYSTTYEFLNIFRSLRPDVPIIMVGCPMHTYYRYNSHNRKLFLETKAAFLRCYEQLKAEFPENIYYVRGENLYGVDQDGTVDDTHLTDLGFKYYAEALTPMLREILYSEK